MKRALEYEVKPLSLRTSDAISHEYSSHADIMYNLQFKDTPGYKGDGIAYTPNVMFPFCIWYKSNKDVYWGCYHIMVNFMNSHMDFDDIAKQMNSRVGKEYVLRLIQKEMENKDRKGQLTFDESKVYDVCKDYEDNTHEREYIVKVLPLVMNMERFDVFERHMGKLEDQVRTGSRFYLDRRFMYENDRFRRTPAVSSSAPMGVRMGAMALSKTSTGIEKVSADLYSFAIEYEADNTTWFYNLFWDDNYGVDTEEEQDRLLTDHDGSVWERFCAYNEFVPQYMLDMAASKIGHVRGVFPVYIDTAIILDVNIMNSYIASVGITV